MLNSARQIIEGWWNNWLRNNPEVEQEAIRRLNICTKCSHIDMTGNNCKIKGTHPCCKKCGCSLEAKARAISAKCPENKWEND